MSAVTEVRELSIAQKTLLVCGILASLLYAAMLVVVPMRWSGYASASQTVSELSAIGAPSRSLWVSLARVYTVLAIAFGSGVWAVAGANRRLRGAGAVLIAQSIAGIFWPPMHLRGAAPTLTDALHVAFAMAWLLLMLLAMALAAASLGRRFRLYSLATLVVFIVFGTLSGMDGPRVAANLPTPWVGIWERINIGASLVWVVVLAVTLLRRGRERKERGTGNDGLHSTLRPASRASRPATRVHGFVAPGFEEVRAEFERNFAERGEIGAAVAAYWGGEKVVDLWGGRRAPNGDDPWNEDTMVVVNSTTKGMAAMTLAVANARGWLDYDAPVTRYWPEFAQNGKEAVTVRQLLGHDAGLVLLDEPLTLEKLRDLDFVARVLARQKPAWPPGTRHGYHTMTIGLYMQEIIRRVDPAHRTLGHFFHEEIARPLGLDFFIGLPREIPDERVARLKTLSPWRGLLALRNTPLAVTLKMITPGSLLRRSFVGLSVDPNDRRYLDVEVPAGNGVGTARAIARAYSCFAEGGAELGITPETFSRLTAPLVMAGSRDVVIGIPSYFALGFLRPGPDVSFGLSERAFGAPGAGGSFAFADPDAQLGYAYVMNMMDFYLTDDPREKSLRDAIYRAMRRLSAQPMRVTPRAAEVEHLTPST
jgi:CubicO group peptidase (beta-lactamase class C family)